MNLRVSMRSAFPVLLSAGLSLMAGAPLRAEDPAPAPSPMTPVAGTLVICGGGRLPEQVPQKFVELAGGKDARIVVIPTASRRAEDAEVLARILAFWKEQEVASLDVLHTRSRETADDEAFSAALETATGVWFTGGNQNNITSVYLGTLTGRRLHALLERGGVIGGTSAGAAIMSRIMIEGGRAGEPPRLGDGMGFLDGAIVDQHFLKRRRQDRLTKAVCASPNTVGFGIDEGTALVVQGTSLSVIGESEVCVCLPPASEEGTPTVERLKPGDQADMQVYCSALTARGTSLPDEQ